MHRPSLEQTIGRRCEYPMPFVLRKWPRLQVRSKILFSDHRRYSTAKDLGIPVGTGCNYCEPGRGVLAINSSYRQWEAVFPRNIKGLFLSVPLRLPLVKSRGRNEAPTHLKSFTEQRMHPDSRRPNTGLAGLKAPYHIRHRPRALVHEHNRSRRFRGNIVVFQALAEWEIDVKIRGEFVPCVPHGEALAHDRIVPCAISG